LLKILTSIDIFKAKVILEAQMKRNDLLITLQHFVSIYFHLTSKTLTRIR
jgi:hypothetical protein